MNSTINTTQTQTPIDPQGRLDIAASRVATRILHHAITEKGMGDLAEGITELAQPFIEGLFTDLFGSKPVSLPVKLVQGVQSRLINGIDSKVSEHREKK